MPLQNALEDQSGFPPAHPPDVRSYLNTMAAIEAHLQVTHKLSLKS